MNVFKNIYIWIIHHPKVVLSPISNDRLNLSIDEQSRPQLVPKLLLQILVRELHNITVSPSEEGGLKEARDAEDNITILD